MQPRSANITSLAYGVADSLIPELETMLRKIAYDSAWPADLIAALSVIFDDDYVLRVAYPDDMAEKIEDMEYGTPFRTPNAAIRPFILRANGIVSQGLSDSSMLDEIFDMEGVL